MAAREQPTIPVLQIGERDQLAEAPVTCRRFEVVPRIPNDGLLDFFLFGS